MDLRPITTVAGSRQQELDLLEGVDVNERVVTSTDGLAAIGHLARVVPIAQHAMDAADTQGRRRALGGCPGGEAELCEVIGQRNGCPVAAGVEVKCERHEWAAIRIDLNPSNVLPLDEVPLREVAGWGLERRSAELVLLHQPFGDLGGKVVGVVLRERGEHAVHQPASGRGVDVLAGGNQGDPAANQALVERGVVEAVSSEPVDLVDDQASSTSRA